MARALRAGQSMARQSCAAGNHRWQGCAGAARGPALWAQPRGSGTLAAPPASIRPCLQASPSLAPKVLDKETAGLVICPRPCCALLCALTPTVLVRCHMQAEATVLTPLRLGHAGATAQSQPSRALNSAGLATAPRPPAAKQGPLDRPLLQLLARLQLDGVAPCQAQCPGPRMNQGVLLQTSMQGSGREEQGQPDTAGQVERGGRGKGDQGQERRDVLPLYQHCRGICSWPQSPAELCLGLVRSRIRAPPGALTYHLGAVLQQEALHGLPQQVHCLRHLQGSREPLSPLPAPHPPPLGPRVT